MQRVPVISCCFIIFSLPALVTAQVLKAPLKDETSTGNFQSDSGNGSIDATDDLVTDDAFDFTSGATTDDDVSPSETPSEKLSPLEESRRLYEAGIENFNFKNYEVAATLFHQAYNLRPDRNLWFNIGQAEAAARHTGLALEAFEKYLNLAGEDISADREAEALNQLRILREKVGRIEVVGAPRGATVVVNDVVRATVPLVEELRVPAGIPHQVDVVFNGNIIHSQPLVVGSRGTVVIRLADHNERTLIPPQRAIQESVNGTSVHGASGQPFDSHAVRLRPLRAFTIASTCLALASGGAAIAFWLIAEDKNNTLNEMNDSVINHDTASPTKDELERQKEDVEQYDMLTNVAIAGAAVFTTAAIISGLVLYRKNGHKTGPVSFSSSAITVRF